MEIDKTVFDIIGGPWAKHLVKGLRLFQSLDLQEQ